MIHEEGAPVWIRVGRTDHHAHIVSAVVKGGESGSEPASYEVRWSSNGTVQEVESSDVIPDEGGRSRTRRRPAARQMKCALGSGGRKKAGPRGAGPREEYAIGQEIKKHFPGHGTFRGSVTGSSGEFYRVKYEDDDEEDIHRDDIGEFVELAVKSDGSPAAKKAKKVAKMSVPAHDELGDESDGETTEKPKARPARKRSGEDRADPETPRNGRANKQTRKSETADETRTTSAPQMASPSSTSRYGRARKPVQYENMRSEWSSDATSDDDDDDDFTSGNTGKTRARGKPKASSGAAKKKSAGRKRPPPPTDEESSEESEASSVDSESSEDLSEDFVEEEEESDDDEEDFVPKKKSARGRKPSATKASKSGGKSNAGKVGMAESFKPTNHPPFHDKSLKQIHEEKEFLDPCGVEGTDNIIDRLVGNQVDRIGALLSRALRNPKCLGSKGNPLKLGTACSGTDAPALGLAMSQEQMALRQMKDEEDGDPLLRVEHNFSCEVDPFKQAYLARNFDSILYPDIGKLCDDPPRDVYGRPTKLPDFNLFVAGTSCKNFSGLRTKFKLDIEAKGCSGETFLAAVELLLKETPEFAIFENVIGAPWEKMKEYITGRIKLDNCSSAKQIGEVKAAEKKMDLSFVLEDGKIIVDHVPGVFGVRCGSDVGGFMKGSSTKVQKVSFPTAAKCKKSKKCSLTELMAHNKIVKANDTLVFKTGVTYCAHFMKVDTKDFGLPQTRQRTYMFVWQPDGGNINDDLGQYWEAIVTSLKAPVRHSLESFILQDNHDIIRVFREALAGPAGRTSKRAAFLEPDFWASSSANLKYSTITRARSGINATARTLTSWGAFGQKQCPPHYWMEYLNICSQRQLDLMEILHASALRDTESHDSSFSSYYWNISQNAGKEKHRSAVSGIAGCVTPGGNMFLPHLGRPLLGSEKLMLQGIPLFRLLLGNETEVQLGDLAGNAMSLTVVNATILGAIACKQLREECNEAKGLSPEVVLEKAANPTESLADRIAKDISRSAGRDTPIESEVHQVFKDLLPIAVEAVESSILCTCESSGRYSASLEFVKCLRCGVSCCRDCLSSHSGHQLASHCTESFKLSSRKHGTFQSKLHSILPTSIVFGEEVNRLSPEHRARNLDKFVFSLHRIRRDRKAWRIVYYARVDGGTGEAIAEFTITLGEIKRRGNADTLGVQGLLTSFLPAKLPPLDYGPISPCARVTLSNGSGFQWMQRMMPKTSDLVVKGKGDTPSFRAEAGINDEARLSIHVSATSSYYQKHVTAARKRGEERRFCYASCWKVWPKEVTIEGGSPDASAVHGVYNRADCRQTTNQSCMYVREAQGSMPTLFLLMQPQVSRNGPDYAVVSSSISHEDASSILACFPAFWEPCDALDPKHQRVKNVQLSSWMPLDLKCRVPKTNIKVSSPKGSADFLEVSGLSELDIAMLTRSDARESTSDCLELNITRGQEAQQTLRVFNSIFTTPIHKFDAEGHLIKYDLSPDASWIKHVQSPLDVAIGCCEMIIPRKPVERWSFDDERGAWIRAAEPSDSRRYFKSLQEAPNTFTMILNAASKKLVIKCDPKVVSHKAAHNLIEGRGDAATLSKEVSVTYRLSDAARQTDPILDPFIVSNCETLEQTSIDLDTPYELYDRQKKVVTKMAAIEDGETIFEELEMFDEQMPGSTGWSCIAKATRSRSIQGGVIADAIGAGKTVISIALILRGIAKARAARKPPAQSSATLVVVPPGLLNQWQNEVNKFAASLKVICVYDLNCLKKLTAKDLLGADVVVCPIDILEGAGYLHHLLRESGNPDAAPKLPMYSGQQEKNEARGVWIPGTSQDPYAGGKGRQDNRNESAHYTYVYTTAIKKLRMKSYKQSDKGVPLEYFCWERVIVDEIHESLCTSKGEMNAAKEAAKERDSIGFFREKNRRAGRELMGITEKNLAERPLRFRTSIFGLTGTPLLDNCDRVIELANLIGGTYVIGLSSHWRRLERESMRDIFLQHYLDPKQSREVRRHIYSYCQKYLDTACCRNKTGDEMESIVLTEHRTVVEMNDEECKLYLGSMSGIPARDRSLAIKPADFDVTSGHDISKFLRQNSKLACRGKALVDTCRVILNQKGNERTKIIVFADGRIGAGAAARDFLCAEADLGCTWLDSGDDVEEKNKKISWYQSADVTAEDCARPRVLVLNFEHAAGLNLQTESNNLILFSPLYVGEGGTSGDAVADASTELQAIGRVYRPGQSKQEVHVYRIEVRGQKGEECLDGHLIRRNSDKDTVAMATNAAD